MPAPLLKPSIDKNLVSHPKEILRWFCVSFGSLFWYFVTSSSFFVCFSFYEMLHICNTYHLTTNVTNIWLLQNMLKNCVTVPKQSSSAVAHHNCLKGSCCTGKCISMQIQLIDAILLFYQIGPTVILRIPKWSHLSLKCFHIQPFLTYILNNLSVNILIQYQPQTVYPHLGYRTIKYLRGSK